MNLSFGQMVSLEWSKEKRTGAFACLVAAGVLGGLYALANFAWRKDSLLGLSMGYMDILLTQMYGMMALFNAFGIIVSSCLVYHLEFQEHGLDKMRALSLSMGQVYCSKFFLLTLALFCAIALESLALLWIGLFDLPAGSFELGRWFSFSLYTFWIALPTLAFMVWMASLFETLWLPLGIGVAGFFGAMALASSQNALWLFNPFLVLLKPAMEMQGQVSWNLCLVALLETILFFVLGLLSSQRRPV